VDFIHNPMPTDKNEGSRPYWYAVYTRSKAERKVLAELERLGVIAYLPLVTRIKLWSDRKKKVIEPLFRSYLFVLSYESDHFKVVQTEGVLKIVGFGKKPVKIPDQQIEAIRFYVNDLTHEEEVGPENLNIGQLVRVKHGPMEGLIGRLIRNKNKFRLIVMIEAVGKSITINIPRTRVEAAPPEADS
jgi:transcription antitermination factor NusG